MCGHSIGSGNWSGLKLTWQNKKTIVAFSIDFKDHLNFSQVMASHFSLLKSTILTTLKELCIFYSEIKQHFLIYSCTGEKFECYYFSTKIYLEFKISYFFVHEEKSLNKSRHSPNIIRTPCFPAQTPRW